MNPKILQEFFFEFRADFRWKLPKCTTLNDPPGAASNPGRFRNCTRRLETISKQSNFLSTGTVAGVALNTIGSNTIGSNTIGCNLVSEDEMSQNECQNQILIQNGFEHHWVSNAIGVLKTPLQLVQIPLAQIPLGATLCPKINCLKMNAKTTF